MTKLKDNITGEGIILRPATLDDTGLIIRWRNSELVRPFFLYTGEFTPESQERWYRENILTGRAVQFIICSLPELFPGLPSHTPLGCVYIHRITGAEGSKTGEFGIYLGEETAYGHGVGLLAARLIISHGFESLGLNSIALRVRSDNGRAMGTYLKAGFKPTGEDTTEDGAAVTFMEILAEEYSKQVHASSAADVGTSASPAPPCTAKLVSFVIPCYGSEHTLEQVVSEIHSSMEAPELSQKYRYELILVNDYSPDGVLQVIRRLCSEYDNITGVDLSKNFGQHAAVMAGLSKTGGDIVICLDDDGQTPADEVDKLIDAVENGSDVVYAAYHNKKHSIFRNFGSRINDLMTRIMLGKPGNLQVTSYFAMRRFIVDEVLKYSGAYPYLIGLVLRSAKNITNVYVSHRNRTQGSSGYTLKKLVGLWMNGFTAFSILPLRCASMMGFIFSLAGFGYGVYTIIKKFIFPDVPMGFSALMSAVVFMGGMIMLMLGMIGEYVGRIYITMNQAPQYIIREVICPGTGSIPND